MINKKSKYKKISIMHSYKWKNNIKIKSKKLYIKSNKKIIKSNFIH